MMRIDTIESVSVENLVSVLAQRRNVDPNHLLIFSDSTTLTTELLRLAGHTARMVVAGHATAELAIAADRAGISLEEVIGSSPFSGNGALILRQISSPDTVVFAGNPNRVTGQNYSLTDLERIAKAVPRGMVIVDEYYLDHFGISAASMVDTNRKTIVLGSFAPTIENILSETGYVLACPEIIGRLEEQMCSSGPSLAIRRKIASVLSGDEPLSRRFRELNDEALRVATGLNRLGVQCRITATDFLLMRVKEPKQVGNFLARHKIPIENLTGYPEMKHYIRYRISSFRANSQLVETFRRMPLEYYRMKTLDLRSQKLRLVEHSSRVPAGRERVAVRDILTRAAGSNNRTEDRNRKLRTQVK